MTRYCWLLLAALFPACAVLAQPQPISRDLPNGVEVVRDLPYASYGDRELLLDLYRPAGNTNTLPAIVVIRGGGWAQGDKEGYAPIAAALALRGFVTVSIEYRTSMEAPFPAAVHDTKAAVRWLRANAREYRINPVAIGAIGGSAGAHLAAYLGVTKGLAPLEGNGGNAGFGSTIQAVVGLATPASLIPVGGCTDNLSDPRIVAFLGAGCAEDEGLWAYASPITHVRESSPPIMLIHSAQDPVVTYTDSLLMAMTYGRANVPVEVEIIPGDTHAFWNFTTWFDDTIERSADFLHRHLDN